MDVCEFVFTSERCALCTKCVCVWATTTLFSHDARWAPLCASDCVLQCIVCVYYIIVLETCMAVYTVSRAAVCRSLDSRTVCDSHEIHSSARFFVNLLATRWHMSIVAKSTAGIPRIPQHRAASLSTVVVGVVVQHIINYPIYTTVSCPVQCYVTHFTARVICLKFVLQNCLCIISFHSPNSFPIKTLINQYKMCA